MLKKKGGEKMIIILAIMTAVYVAMVYGTIINMYRQKQKSYLAFKTITSIIFVLLGAAAYRISGSEFFAAFLPAYIFCLIGDVLLALAHEIDNNLKNPQFTLGVGAFAIAHLFFIWRIQMYMFAQVSIGGIIMSLLLGAYTVWTTKNSAFEYGSNKVPSILYALIVGFLGGMGIELLIGAITEGLGSPAYVLMALGMVFFMISDTILANKYFRKEARHWYGAAVLIFYYGAMGLLTVFPAIL